MVYSMTTTERKGLRFEVETTNPGGVGDFLEPHWFWVLVGADGPVCRSVDTFYTEEEARSNIAASKGRMKAARFAKVLTVDE